MASSSASSPDIWWHGCTIGLARNEKDGARGCAGGMPERNAPIACGFVSDVEELQPYNQRKSQRMSDKQPTVSIGMPVYNGENYIAAALDSILAQSFSDFEVVISDNASTDHTEEICRNYQARDPRIRYYRNPKNLGAARNHNQVFTLSCGKYFKWASHDDILSPDFLARCVAVLEQDPSVVLCHSRIMVIDDFNKRTVPLQDAVGLGMSHSPAQRFGSVILHDRSCADIYGLIRSDILRKT